MSQKTKKGVSRMEEKYVIKVLERMHIDPNVLQKQKLEIDRLNKENERLKVRLRTLMPCGYCKHSEKEPVEICTPCLCGECDNWEP
jgi:hypothetical protein